MIALHSIWTGSALRLWGEDSKGSQAPTKQQGLQSKSRQPHSHPFALPHKRLMEEVAAVAGPSLVERAEKEEMALRLPSDSKGPLSSPELVWEDGGSPSGRSGRRLRPWGVPCLALGPSAALGLLAGLPEIPPAGTSLGASLRYWAEVAKLCLEILAQERFVPDLDEDGNGGLRAMWRPLFEAEDVRERLRILASAMPPICRALDGGEPSPGPIALVESFLGASVDGAVRRWVVSGPILSRKRVPKIKETSVAQRWLAALLSEDPRILVSSNQASAFIKDIRAWTAQLRPPGTEAAFRTCFRLDPPAGQEEPSPPAEARTWAISYHLQATDDRSLLIDAATIWKERSGTLTFLKRRFENPQERLLADLGRASRLFPTLEESLRSPRPAACKLSVEQAYSFLRESVPLLEESGFGVLVPPWWQKPAARLGVRLKVRARDAGKTGAGLMGLGSLVDYDWEVALGDEKLSREEFEKLSALKVPLVQVRGQWVELRPQEIEAAIQFFEKRQRGALTLSQALHLGLAADTSETGVLVVGLEAEGWISELMKGLASGTPMEELPPPEGFRGILRPYQIRGYSWMAFLDRFGLGACLADDMGLGKTIQLIALLLHERLQKKRTGPTLLIAPMSVVGNWQREMERFAPSLKVMVHHGAERLSGPAFERQARKHDLVISTYGLAHRDQPHLASVSWERVALDEAQNIKNPSTKQTLAIRSLRARSRLALTGTPVENRLSDLWSIMEFLNPGYLGSAGHFRQAFALPVEKYRDEERLGSLRRLVQPFLLRRLKSDPNIIQDLPEKMEMKVFCNLTREQASLYQAVVKDMMGKIEESEGINRKGLVLATLMKLKQVCNHPAHFLQDGSPLEGRSGKLLRLVEMLEEALAEGDRALVFTQYAEMGQMLKAHLQDKLGREVIFLHGGVQRKARDQMVRRFQEEAGGPPVFVLSLKAGGTGLNLTAASHVFHFDRWWNPAVEAQATDRAFRIGQKRNVQVHKYVCAGTLEERIDQLMEQKKELAESVMSAGEGWLTEMSTDQLRHLLALSREAVVED